MKRTPFPHRRSARGMTLIELLVAMVIMTIGIVGLVTLMARASQATAGVEDSQRAALLASDLANDMWAYGVLNPPTTAAWVTRVATATQSGLPNATGTVAVDATTQIATITVSWTPPTGIARQYVTQVRLN
ncbi:type IV pilus modification PilV family protein [Roseateles chitinivorans]|uniref:type IV pilus modification PilV family protein n=1 Tax=Roseateles chitinivorans TaxID=2917965 RepID=UPI003D6723EF